MKVIVDDRIIDLTIEMVAEELAAAHSDTQAQFFNRFAESVGKWDNAPGSFAMQLQAITDEECLTDEARSVMSLIGEYSEQAAVTEID